MSSTRETCLICETCLVDSASYLEFRVCQVCTFHYSMTARERVDSLADPGTFSEINRRITSLDPLSFSSRGSYRQRIFRDQRRTGLPEAIITGTCAVGGSQTMLIVLDFGFMGGTMGCVVGEKVALAFEYATKRKLPTIAVVTSGGARIQEGVLSLMQMAKTTLAVSKFNEKGLPFITVLANPATGQAFASFANQADIILAEPATVMGFSPLRVIKESSEQDLPPGALTAESHYEHGMVDAVVKRPKLKAFLSVLLDLLGSQYVLRPVRKGQAVKPVTNQPEAWDSVQLARHESRPSSVDYLRRITTNFVEIHGDRVFGDDPAIICGIGHLAGQTVVVIGQERGKQDAGAERNDGRMAPDGFRKAQRAMRLASKFQIPLITLIDTPGPYLSMDAEIRGLGNVISGTMSLMANLDVPSLSVVIGEGGNAAALALGVADRVLMLENAIYSAISPEDAAEVIFQDEDRADEVAESLKLTAQDCLEMGIVDVVVPEPAGGAHKDPDEAARQLRRVLLHELSELQTQSLRRVLNARYKKFRKMGEYSSRFRAAIVREVDSLQGYVSTGVRRITRRRSSKPDGDRVVATRDCPDVDPGNRNGV